MNDLEVYKFYSALYLHFTKDSYDFFKRRGKTNRSEIDFNLCQEYEKKIFYKLSNICEPKNYLIGNFLFNDKKYIRYFNNENHLKYHKYLNNGKYIFSEELKNIDIPIRNIFKRDCNGAINIVRYFLNKRISLFSLCIFEHLSNWCDKLEKDLLNEQVIKIVKKSHKFFKVNNDEYQNILKQGLK